MSGRRLKVDRTPALGLSALNPGQMLEIRKMVEEEVSALKAETQNLTTQLEAMKVYVCNLSTIMRDVQSSVLLAKYGTGSTKAVLAELIQSLELSLDNVQHLPPSYSSTTMYHWTYPAEIAQNTSPPAGNRFVPDDPDELFNDPVSDVSDF